RQALNYAIDKDSIVQSLIGGFGRPLAGPLSQLLLGFNPDVKPYPFDTAKAKSLLAAAGVPDGFSVDMDMTSSYSSALAEAVVAVLSDVGIKFTLTTLESAVYSDRWVKQQISPTTPNHYNTTHT